MSKFLLSILLLLTISLHAQVIYTSEDSLICNKIFNDKNIVFVDSLKFGDLVVNSGKSFIGTDYVAGTLDAYENEQLVINLRGLDCYTFTDNSLAIARTIASGNKSFEKYRDELQNIRYRSGKIDGYVSRLHYVSDWIDDLTARGIMQDVTQLCGGVVYDKQINFMSEHADKYAHLKGNAENRAKIKSIEDNINKNTRYYIPKAKLTDDFPAVENGDIIAITTSIKGLDVSHIGIAVRGEDGNLYFMHAPNTGYKVQITKKTLAEYLAGNKKQTGIMVFRALP